MPKRGNWGDWAVIDLPKTEIKVVSCYACSHYYAEDGSCLKTPIIPSKDGEKTAWKTCHYFELDSKYMTSSFMKTVKKVKGNNYVFKNQKIDDNAKPKVVTGLAQETQLICDYEIGSWIKSNKFGTGRLVAVSPGKVVIDFSGKQVRFAYPLAFDECHLFLVYGPGSNEEDVIPSEANKIQLTERIDSMDETGVADIPTASAEQIAATEMPIMDLSTGKEAELNENTFIFAKVIGWIKNRFGK